jgi:energy-coupling factor transporter ATP-binding protein EcfA2
MRDDIISGLTREGTALDLVLSLLGQLRSHDIRYCYWKSRRRIRAALAGESDLDLLVSHQDQHRMEALLLGCGFKPFPYVAGWEHPAISSFLGYDEPSGRLVHVHLHHRLVVGPPLLKPYRLPWEDALLRSAGWDPALPIRVLAPEAEFLLLAVRACLELSPWSPSPPGSRRKMRDKLHGDREAVRPAVDGAALRAMAADLLGSNLAAELVEFARSGAAPDGDAQFRRRLHRHVAPWRSWSGTEMLLRVWGRSCLWAAAALNARVIQAPRPARRRAPGGGGLVAVVGVDGSGKSSLVGALRGWLAAETSVMPIYFGTGDGRPSLMLLPLKIAARAAQRLRRTRPKGSSHGRISDRPPSLAYSAGLAVWAAVLAVEKRRKLQAARRGADRGMVVVADRYPQDQIAEYNDSPLLPRVAAAPGWLRRFEAEAYALARRMPPDLVIKLDAPAALIRVREPDMDPSLIERRTADLRRLAFPGAVVVSIDATLPFADVVGLAKAAVWRML